MHILILDDQRSARIVLRRMLASLDGATLQEVAALDEARLAIEKGDVDLVLADIRLSQAATDRGGLDLLGWMRETGRAVPTIVVTAFSEMCEVRQAMRLGALDYVVKDELSPEMLLPIIRAHTERLRLRGEVNELRSRSDRTWGLGAIKGSSSPIAELRTSIERVADSPATVMIRGETGTGKELCARAIHQRGPRCGRPFVALNCATIPAALMESSLFGHERGAFTGADRKVRGQLELAEDGTLFFDEIGELSMELQAKLLRVMEEREFMPVGAARAIPLRARILAATHVDLEERIATGAFREDLYYRLNVVTIDLPPLRDRTTDLPELVAEFAADLARPIRFSSEAMQWLVRRRWPGNVRELRNVVERVSILSDTSHIDVETLVRLVGVRRPSAGSELDQIAKSILALSDEGPKLEAVERAVLERALEHANGNKSAAARLLGIHRKSLERRWARLQEGEPE